MRFLGLMTLITLSFSYMPAEAIIVTPSHLLLQQFTQVDTTPPQITDVTPTANQTDVSVNQVVEFTVLDTDSGVDVSTLSLSVGDRIITQSQNTQIQDGYVITYSPVPPWSYDFTYQVFISISDFAGNIATMDFSFTTESAPTPTPTPEFQDTTPPEVYNQSPAPGETDVSTDTMINFTIGDDESGVDITTLNLIIGGDLITTYNYTGDERAYDITYDPPAPLQGYDTYDVQISVSDIAGNLLSSSYSFTTGEPSTPAPTNTPIVDIDPPQVLNRTPAPNAVDVSVGAVISFSVADAGLGIDLSSLDFLINGFLITDFYYTGDPSQYNINYDPIGGLNYNTIYEVHITVSDQAGNSVTDNYQFTTGGQPTATPSLEPTDTPHPDIEPPQLLNRTPPAYAADISVSTNIGFTMSDADSGVDDSTLDFTVDGISITGYTISGDPSSYVVNYDPPELLYDRVYQVSVSVSDLAGNQLDESYSFTTESAPTPTPLPTCPPCQVTMTQDFGLAWNLIGFTYIPLGVTSAQELTLSLAADGVVANNVAMWNGRSWEIYEYPLPFNNFTIEPKKGYFIRCSQGGTWEYEINRCQ